ncbi:phospho-sugar mutase [Nakamurella sp. YIM 132087]|uniref:Phospho-sugar mutase n=1 Tax=Nakamurella alba TaxID=2665158 RepID=A0A7K1FJE5_9ACTN|nr:phospho-sugar mutase [Nakamurella alba]MTD14218.1 phospho-sugar mutase [Nakamurella alba]
MALSPALRDAALTWIADDPHEGDRAELQRVLRSALDGDGAAAAELDRRMSAPLAFGTAGIRGPLRAGPAGMNLAVVRRTAAGLASYLHGLREIGSTVVVGYDARHRSEEFAKDVAGTLAAKGFRVLLAPSALPTPLVAYATRALRAAAGVQVTASHNPPQDNGIKVYLKGGTQLVGPSDVQIEAGIAAAGPAKDIDASGAVLPWPEDLLTDYLAAAAAVAQRSGSTPEQRSAVRVAATPLHGVGGEILVRALDLAGVQDVHVVAEQRVPDPDFSTVVFPNPEEAGATDLLLALAESVDADLAIANDPDADRCAIGVRGPDGWRMLSGDETGTLLGDHLLRHLDRAEHPDPLVATTIVSSQALGAVAAAHGVRYDETLTGFKWIVRAGDGAGTGLVFGYEEALGLCVDPDHVRDKDGISAAVLAVDLVAGLKAAGRTVADALDDIARRDGLHLTGALSVRVTDLSLIEQAMARLRSGLPGSLAGEEIVDARNLLPRTDAVLIRTAAGSRVVIRPSGTEPKLKCYLEVVAEVPDGTGDLTAIRAEATERLGRLKAAAAELVGLG